jgi:uncharacterized protein YutE (UPF0331/DUF86 family)
MKRIKDKIVEINVFLTEMEEVVPEKVAEYKDDIIRKAACERYVEKIVEAAVDLAFLVIKSRKLKIPEDDLDAFNILLDNKVINSDLAKKMKQAKGMRNILAHQYGKVDDEVVFEAVSKQLVKDVKKFVDAVK